MQQEETFIPSLVRRAMKNATEADLLEATENLKRYLRALYAMFLWIERQRLQPDSPRRFDHGRFEEPGCHRMAPGISPSMKRFFAYVRVSTAKQGQFGSSLQEQRDAILAFAQRQGFVISEWFEDRETAAKAGRTQFTRMMAQLDKGKASGVLLHKIDRGARNLWDWARIQSLLDAGVEVHFVHDHFDMKSRGGRLAADIQAVVAADFIRNLSDETHKAIRGRLKQGLYPFRAPLGYLDQGPGKPKVIHPVIGPLIRQAFELYASGRFSLHALRSELQRRGLCRRNGGPLHLNSVANILHNPFYAGIILLRESGETFAGAHKALISVSLFNRVQGILQSRKARTVQRHDFLYRRLLKCKNCSTTLIGERQKGLVYYRCHTAGCLTKCIREDAVSKQWFATSAAIQFTDQDRNELLPMLNEESMQQLKALEAAARASRLRLDATLDRVNRLTDAYLEQLFSKEEYEQRRASLNLELADARQALSDIDQSAQDFGLTAHSFFDFVARLGPQQAQCDPAGFRQALMEATSNWVVDGKKLCIAMQSPFQELCNQLTFQCGVPFRGVPRTSTGGSPSIVTAQRDHRSIANILVKHLAGWQPPHWIIRTKALDDPAPRWRQNLANSQDDDGFK